MPYSALMAMIRSIAGVPGLANSSAQRAKKFSKPDGDV
jgi:hypothetical protein